MTSLTATAPLAATQPAIATPPVFGLRIIIGLVGVLLAVLVSGLNEMVTKVALADIRGALAIGYDEGTWLVASYAATSVAAAAFAPWCAVTYSLRRFTLCAIGAFTLLGVLCPLAPNYESLLILRTLQGLAGGALPPMLMTVALRFLPPNVKLYGLAGYALTATFGPGLGTPLAGLWTEYVGWQWTFWQVVVPCLIAMAAVAYGIPQDPLRLERFKQFNWRGLLLGFAAICMLVVGILQGNRLDWFESNLISGLLMGGALLTSAWIRDDFYALQWLQIFGQPMAVLPLLMLATGSINPMDGPFASSWFNTVKGLSAVIATGVLETLTTARLHFHSTMLVDHLGNSPLVDADSAGLAHRLHEQAVVLTAADLYLCMAGIAVALILLIFWLPTRVFPPRAAT